MMRLATRPRAPLLPQPPCRWVGPALLALLCSEAGAQAAAAGERGSRPLTITPSASVTQTVTDNSRRNGTDREPDAITQLSAGVSVRARTPNVQGALDYQLSGSVHARESRGNRVANALSSNLSANVIDQWLRIDAAASIQQSVISAFGPQTVDPTFDNANTTEVRSFFVSPSLRRPIGSVAIIDARYAYSQQSSSRSELGDSASQVASVNLASQQAGRFGWNLGAQRSRYDYNTGSLTTDSVNGGLSYRPTPDLSLRVLAGRDKTDVLVRVDQGTTHWGVGLDWVPSPRTRLSMQRDERYFGTGHRVSFAHRLQRALITFTSSRDVASPVDRVRTGTTTLFELLFANLDSVEPDPILREQLVLQRLLALGLNPQAQVSLNFLSSAATIRNAQDLGLAWTGPRSSLSLSLHRTETERLENTVALNGDDLAFGGRVRQQGFVLSFGHRLSPTTGFSSSFSRSRNDQSETGQSNTLQAIRLGLNGRFGNQGHWGLGARRVEFDSTTSSYTENAVYATLGVRF